MMTMIVECAHSAQRPEDALRLREGKPGDPRRHGKGRGSRMHDVEVMETEVLEGDPHALGERRGVGPLELEPERQHEI